MLRRIFTLLGCAALALALNAVPVAADDVGGGFDVRTAPAVRVGAPDGDISPFVTELTVTVDVDMGAGALLSDLDSVVFKTHCAPNTSQAYFEGLTPHSSGCAIITWNGATFSFAAGTGSTWDLNESATAAPASLAEQSGTFTFVFTPGKVAAETKVSNAQWQFGAEAIDGSYVGYDLDNEGADMLFYQEVDAPASIDWGTVSPPLAFDDSGPSRQALTPITVIANFNILLQIECDDTTWGNGSNFSTDGEANAENEFALKADDDLTIADAVTVGATAVTVRPVNFTDDDGDNIVNINIWLSINQVFPSGSFSGTITITAKHSQM